MYKLKKQFSFSLLFIFFVFDKIRKYIYYSFKLVITDKKNKHNNNNNIYSSVFDTLSEIWNRHMHLYSSGLFFSLENT